MESDHWPQIYTSIQQHLQKIYNGKKAALKERHWVPDEDGTYDIERIRRGRPSHISEVDWDAQIAFWNDPKNLDWATQNKQNQTKSKVVCRQGSRSIAALRDMHMESSATREYPSLIHTFFLTHTVGGEFLNPKDKALYDEMLRLQGLGSNTSTGVPYTEDEIMAIVYGGKQRGHIPGVGRVLLGQGTVIPPPPPCTHSSDVAKLKKSEKRLTKQREWRVGNNEDGNEDEEEMLDGLSAITTKLGTPLMLDSYTTAMCTDSWGRASYARAMVELRAGVELRDTIMVDVLIFIGEGFTKRTIHVEYEWTPPRGRGNQAPSTNDTPVVARINDLERQMLDEKLVFVDEHGKPLEMESKSDVEGDQGVESDEDKVEMPDDEMSRYIALNGRGGLLKDDLDCYNG
ncbi:RNA-directed DNA polymerase, eukaryota [Tanacetum coccineum]